MNFKLSLVAIVFSVLASSVVGNYINLHECIQNKCFSLYQYCQKEAKCQKSYQLVNLCSQVNSESVGQCIDNIHNYLHVALQQCLSSNCGYNSYYEKCGITNSKIRNCIDQTDSDCFLNNGGKEFKAAVDKCVADTKVKQCGTINPAYTEYVQRCTQLNTLSCYQSSLSDATQTIQELFSCSSYKLKALFALIGLLLFIF